VAGLIDELEIVEQVNQYLGEDPQEWISPGVTLKAMILNLLGYIPRRSAATNIRMSEYVHKSHNEIVLLYHLVFLQSMSRNRATSIL
jgi:hypothetical protein